MIKKELPKLLIEQEELNSLLYNCYWTIINDTDDPYMLKIQDILFETGRDWRSPDRDRYFCPEGESFYGIGKQWVDDGDTMFGHYNDGGEMTAWTTLYFGDSIYREFKASYIIRHYGTY